MDPQNLDQSLITELYKAYKPLFDEIIQEHHAITLAPLLALDQEGLPWNNPRTCRDILVPIQIRLPVHRKLQLKWIYSTYELSMNKYVVNTLEERTLSDIRRELSHRDWYEMVINNKIINTTLSPFDPNRLPKNSAPSQTGNGPRSPPFGNS